MTPADSEDFPALYPATLARVFDLLSPTPSGSALSEGQCIGRTRLGIVVLQELGVTAKPLPCELLVGNPEAGQAIRSGLPRALWRDPIAIVEVHPDSPEFRDREWAAHLVIEWAVAAERGLLDLDLRRYTRPHWRISAQAAAVVYPEDYRDEYLLHDFGDGSVACWHPARHQTRFKKAAAWRQTPNQEDVDILVAAVREFAPDELELLRMRQATQQLWRPDS